jgi:hypothetical protein
MCGRRENYFTYMASLCQYCCSCLLHIWSRHSYRLFHTAIVQIPCSDNPAAPTVQASGSAAAATAAVAAPAQAWVWEDSNDAVRAYAVFFLWLALGSWPALQEVGLIGACIASSAMFCCRYALPCDRPYMTLLSASRSSVARLVCNTATLATIGWMVPSGS